jgi:hypothetical protein
VEFFKVQTVPDRDPLSDIDTTTCKEDPMAEIATAAMGFADRSRLSGRTSCPAVAGLVIAKGLAFILQMVR